MLRVLRRIAHVIGLAMGATLSIAASAQELHKVALAMGDKTVAPISITKLIPEYMGWYKEEGLQADLVPAGSSAAVLGGLASGRFEFGTGLATFQLPIAAKGEPLPSINFFECIYPFKFGIAVVPSSPIRSMADLKGKRMGVSNFGVSGKAIGAELLRRALLDPDRDVGWLATGEGVRGGIALEQHAIDALMDFTTSFGTIEAAGIPLRYIELTKPTPMVGGTFITATPAFLRDHRQWAVGYARAVAKGMIFAATNPEAAAYIFVKLYPEAAPKNMTLRQQVKAVMVPLVKLAPLLLNPDKSKPLGYMRPEEWQEEIRFANFQDQIKDPTVLYTDDLIADINKFDHEKIRRQALNFKIDYGAE